MIVCWPHTNQIPTVFHCTRQTRPSPQSIKSTKIMIKQRCNTLNLFDPEMFKSWIKNRPPELPHKSLSIYDQYFQLAFFSPCTRFSGYHCFRSDSPPTLHNVDIICLEYFDNQSFRSTRGCSMQTSEHLCMPSSGTKLPPWHRLV